MPGPAHRPITARPPYPAELRCRFLPPRRCSLRPGWGISSPNTGPCAFGLGQAFQGLPGIPAVRLVARPALLSDRTYRSLMPPPLGWKASPLCTGTTRSYGVRPISLDAAYAALANSETPLPTASQLEKANPNSTLELAGRKGWEHADDVAVDGRHGGLRLRQAAPALGDQPEQRSPAGLDTTRAEGRRRAPPSARRGRVRTGPVSRRCQRRRPRKRPPARPPRQTRCSRGRRPPSPPGDRPAAGRRRAASPADCPPG